VEPVVLTAWIDLGALWKIIVIGLLAGAGLPALFAIGLKALSLRPAGATATTGATAGGSSPGSGRAEDAPMFGGSVPGLVAAGLCFAVVLVAIGWGIYFVVAGS
jgi:hypothetical protein